MTITWKHRKEGMEGERERRGEVRRGKEMRGQKWKEEERRGQGEREENEFQSATSILL